MPGSYRTSIAMTGGFIIDKPALEDIFGAFRTFVDADLEIELDFSEVHELSSTSLDEALDDPLVRAHQITSLSFSGRNYKIAPTRRVSLRARRDLVLSTIEVDIEGPQSDARSLRSHIETIVLPKRQWYSSIVLSPNWVSGIATVVVVLALLAMPLLLAFLAGGENLLKWAVVAEMALIWPIILILNRMREFVFPKLIIDVGRSAEIGARARGARNILFVVVLIGFAVSVTATVFTDHFK